MALPISVIGSRSLWPQTWLKESGRSRKDRAHFSAIAYGSVTDAIRMICRQYDVLTRPRLSEASGDCANEKDKHARHGPNEKELDFISRRKDLRCHINR
jgi:hypothetical protein